MIKLAVYNKEGTEVDSLKVDEQVFGGRVNYGLLKQAIVMYQGNRVVGTAATKNKSLIEGSTRKLFRQKGTGNARVGGSRTGKRVGGGVTFEKVARDFGKRMPKKQKRWAANSAVLEKLINNNVLVIDQFGIEKAKTKDFAAILGNLKIDRSCLVMLESKDDNIYKSARNIPKITIMPIEMINAGDVCNHTKLLFTKNAIMMLIDKAKQEIN
jgi:large subunit ribosomal protein L4